MKRALAFGLSLMLLAVLTQPAPAHELEVQKPEPDHVLYWAARALYPIGDIVNHLLFGPHESNSSESEEALEGRKRVEPKKNFSPRKKHPTQSEEEKR